MRRSARRFVAATLLSLGCSALSGAASAQIFQRPPCPQFISSGVLGYDGFITFEGIYFPVSSLYHLTPGASDVIYRPVPERPQTRAKAWEMAAVGATCYYWLTPYGALWTVVQETAKFGYVRNLIACGDGGTGIFADFETDPYAPQYDPYGEGYNCDDSPPPSGGGGGGSGGSGSSCHEEWIVIEISYDNGITWETWWEGYATVCE